MPGINHDESYCADDSLSKEEYQKILAVCDDFEDKILIQFAVTTGLRRFDVTAVEVQNINFEKGMLTYTERKKHNRIRTIPLQQNLLTDLKMYLNIRKVKTGPLFTFKDRAAYNHFNVLCFKAGILEKSDMPDSKDCLWPGCKPRPFHALRSTCAKFCRDAGWTLEQTAMLLGDDEKTVQRYYVVPNREDMRTLIRDKPVG